MASPPSSPQVPTSSINDPTLPAPSAELTESQLLAEYRRLILARLPKEVGVPTRLSIVINNAISSIPPSSPFRQHFSFKPTRERLLAKLKQIGVIWHGDDPTGDPRGDNKIICRGKALRNPAVSSTSTATITTSSTSASAAASSKPSISASPSTSVLAAVASSSSSSSTTQPSSVPQTPQEVPFTQQLVNHYVAILKKLIPEGPEGVPQALIGSFFVSSQNKDARFLSKELRLRCMDHCITKLKVIEQFYGTKEELRLRWVVPTIEPKRKEVITTATANTNTNTTTTTINNVVNTSQTTKITFAQLLASTEMPQLHANNSNTNNTNLNNSAESKFGLSGAQIDLFDLWMAVRDILPHNITGLLRSRVSDELIKLDAKWHEKSLRSSCLDFWMNHGFLETYVVDLEHPSVRNVRFARLGQELESFAADSNWIDYHDAAFKSSQTRHMYHQHLASIIRQFDSEMSAAVVPPQQESPPSAQPTHQHFDQNAPGQFPPRKHGRSISEEFIRGETFDETPTRSSTTTHQEVKPLSNNANTNTRDDTHHQHPHHHHQPSPADLAAEIRFADDDCDEQHHHEQEKQQQQVEETKDDPHPHHHQNHKSTPSYMTFDDDHPANQAATVVLPRPHESRQIEWATFHRNRAIKEIAKLHQTEDENFRLNDENKELERKIEEMKKKIADMKQVNDDLSTEAENWENEHLKNSLQTPAFLVDSEDTKSGCEVLMSEERSYMFHTFFPNMNSAGQLMPTAAASEWQWDSLNKQLNKEVSTGGPKFQKGQALPQSVIVKPVRFFEDMEDSEPSSSDVKSARASSGKIRSFQERLWYDHPRQLVPIKSTFAALTKFEDHVRRLAFQRPEHEKVHVERPSVFSPDQTTMLRHIRKIGAQRSRPGSGVSPFPPHFLFVFTVSKIAGRSVKGLLYNHLFFNIDLARDFAKLNYSKFDSGESPLSIELQYHCIAYESLIPCLRKSEFDAVTNSNKFDPCDLVAVCVDKFGQFAETVDNFSYVWFNVKDSENQMLHIADLTLEGM